MKTTISKDTSVRDTEEALIEFYRRLRPGEPPNAENARNLINTLFFDSRRYDLGKVGRYKLDSVLKGPENADRDGEPDDRILDKDRFRKDLGGLMEAYSEVLRRIQNSFEVSDKDTLS